MTDPGGIRAVVTAAAALIALALVVVMAVFTALIDSTSTGTGTGGLGGGTAAGGGSAPGAGASSIPPAMLVLYRQAAATCPGLDWSILAGVGSAETDHGRSTLPGVHSGQNAAGAAGDMQFLEPTFQSVVARHPPPPGGAHPPSRYDAQDAVYTAAAYLCDSGARTTDGRPASPAALRRALLTYNHSSAYVDDVLARAARYRAP